MEQNNNLITIDILMIVQIINFFILVYIFHKYFYKKIGKVIEQRKKVALKDLELVKEEREKLDEQKQNYEKLRKEAKRRANDIIIKAERQADERREQILDNATTTRDRMIMRAESDVLKIHDNIKEQLKDEVSKMATDLAEKIIKENIEKNPENVSKRYALAIYDFATENDEVFEVFEVLNLLLEHIKNDEDFKKFLKYPVIDKEEKKKLINHIYSDVNKQSLKILDYLVDKDRLLHIKEIYEEYSKIYYEKHKKLIVTAIFPKELTEAQKEKLTENLKKLKGKDVVIHYRIDEKLIGGGLIRINDEVIDGSIKTQLNSIKR